MIDSYGKLLHPTDRSHRAGVLVNGSELYFHLAGVPSHGRLIALVIMPLDRH